MDQQTLLDLWRIEEGMYDAWGRKVIEEVETLLSTEIAPDTLGHFLKVPSSFRTKDPEGFVEKAFYRGKEYPDPYNDITDKVGVRFVVLMPRDMELISRVIENSAVWSASQDRHYEDDRRKQPLMFSYSAIHYVVRNIVAAEHIDSNGIVQNLAVGIPCEVQIKTLLQHAYGELTHDTVYKPRVENAPETIRATAKSMALLEATEDYFEDVVEAVREVTRTDAEIQRLLSEVYLAVVGVEPHMSSISVTIVTAYRAQLTEEWIVSINEYYQDHPAFGELIAVNAPKSILYRQPAILLIPWLESIAPNFVTVRWPYARTYLDEIYAMFGRNVV